MSEPLEVNLKLEVSLEQSNKNLVDYATLTIKKKDESIEKIIFYIRHVVYMRVLEKFIGDETGYWRVTITHPLNWMVRGDVDIDKKMVISVWTEKKEDEEKVGEFHAIWEGLDEFDTTKKSIH